MWYIDMLKDARNRGFVKHYTTLWDTFFEGGRDHRMERCSVMDIPYLEGDYWPGEVETHTHYTTPPFSPCGDPTCCIHALPDPSLPSPPLRGS